MKKPVYHHYTDSYLLAPSHPVTVNLIGCGGTGSQVLSNLARIHATLRALGHPGLYVCAWDGDTVSEANLGRQLFSPADMGHPKSLVLVSRINRFFGTDWKAIAEPYDKHAGGNIFITCVDNVAARRKVYEQVIKTGQAWNVHAHLKSLYWLDFGNTNNKGQAILGSIAIPQPRKTPFSIKLLRNVFDIFPDMEKHEAKDTGPSCSVAEAIDKQDLFINSTLAQHGCHMLWRMFREARLAYNGIFLNLDDMNSNTLSVKK